VYETVGNFMETEGIAQLTGMDLSGPVKASSSCSLAGVDTQTVILSLKERVHWLEQRLFEKVYSVRHMSFCYLKGQTRLCLGIHGLQLC
jgi:hypothetical protein